MHSLQERRRRAGWTKRDLEKVTGWSVAHIEAIEDKRRIPSLKEADEMVRLFGGKVSDYCQQPYFDDKHKEAAANLFAEEGMLSHFGSYDESFQRAFMWLMNEVWHIASHIDKASLADMPAEQKHEMIRDKLLDRLLLDKYNEGIFPFAVDTYNPKPSVAWAEVLRLRQTEDQKLTVLLKTINGLGQSVPNAAERFVEDISKRILVPGRMMGESKSGPIYEQVKFISVDPYSDPKNVRYTGLKARLMGDGGINVQFVYDEPKRSKEESPDYRVYRVFARARDLKPPFPRNDADDRCQVDRKGECPLKVGKRTSEQNGCFKCRGTERAWLSWRWLLEAVGDDYMRDHFQFGWHLFEERRDVFDAYKAAFHPEAEDSKVRGDLQTARAYGNYADVSGPINGSYEHLTDGRHRLRSAQILDIEIAFHLVDVTEKMDAELVE